MIKGCFLPTMPIDGFNSIQPQLGHFLFRIAVSNFILVPQFWHLCKMDHLWGGGAITPNMGISSNTA